MISKSSGNFALRCPYRQTSPSLSLADRSYSGNIPGLRTGKEVGICASTGMSWSKELSADIELD